MIDINMTIVAQILNFLILVLILKFVAYKPVMKMLKEREEKIARSIDAAEADEQKAKELLAEYNKQLADARIKAQEIVDKAMKRAQEERDASVAETRREIEQMRKAAKEDIARERERAAMQLRGEMVALSMQAAGKIIAANMDNKTNEKLVSDFIDQLAENDVVIFINNDHGTCGQTFQWAFSDFYAVVFQKFCVAQGGQRDNVAQTFRAAKT